MTLQRLAGRLVVAVSLLVLAPGPARAQEREHFQLRFGPTYNGSPDFGIGIELATRFGRY